MKNKETFKAEKGYDALTEDFLRMSSETRYTVSDIAGEFVKMSMAGVSSQQISALPEIICSWQI